MKFLSQINVNSEYTFPIVDGTNGQVLTTDGNGVVYWSSSVGATNLNALTDVELTSPSTGQILRYEIPLGGSVPVWRNVTPAYLDPNSSINALGDVVITSATSGQILQFNGTYWINTTLSTVEYVSKVQHTVKAGVAITKGQAVYVTTSDGTNMVVGLASNASESTSSKVIGLAASNAATNDQIFVVTEGLLAGLNTSTATAGDPVWLGTNGNLIFGLLNKPVAPAHLVYIGVVTRVQSNNGEIFVNVQNGFELNEIHDALIVSPTAGQLLRRDSDNLWKNWTPNYLTAEADTLATVTARGATTTSNITVNGAAFATSFSATGLLIANADTSGSLQPDQGSPANKIYSFGWAGAEQGYIDTDAKITFAGFKTPAGTASQFLKANGTVDSNTYLTTASAASLYTTYDYVDDEIAAVNTYVNNTFVPKTRTLTINGTAFDLSANRSWTIDTTDSTKVSKSGESHDTVLPDTLASGAGGFYTVANGYGPSGGNDALIHVPYSNNLWAHQIAMDWALGDAQDMWFRTKNNGTWQGWKKVWHDGNFTPSNYQLASTAINTGNIATQSVAYATSSGNSNLLKSLGSYVWSASTNGRDFQEGMQISFVREADGYQSFGSVVRIHTYPNDGASAELYFPYSEEYGGNSMQYRLGLYNNAGWSSWKTVVDSENIGLYALTSLPSHNHDDRYYTETESDSRFYLATNPSGYQTTSGTVANIASGETTNLNSAWTAFGTSIGNGFRVLRYSESATNKPTAQDNANWLINIYSHPTGGTASYGHQLAAANNNNIYFRSVNNGSFSDWHKFWSTNDFSSTAISNWTAAYNDKINSASFNTTNGVLTLTQQDGGTVTVDLDGRYLTSDTDAQTLTWDGGSKTLGITNGNDVILSELATEDFVTSQGYVTSAHTHTIANITGLQTALDGKLSTSGKAADSELIDGIDSSRIIYGDGGFGSTSWSDMNNTAQKSGFFFYNQPTGNPFNDWTHWINSMGNSWNPNYGFQLAHAFHSDRLAVRVVANGGWGSWRTVIDSGNIGSYAWTSANDGASSGLDADLLDGNHASAFALASHTHAYLPLSGGTLSGTLSMSNNDISDINSIYINDPGAGEGINWNGGSGWGIFECPDVFDNTGGNLQFALNASERMMTLDVSGNLWVAGTYTEASSIRFKENINPLDPALDKVTQLEAVSYNKIGEANREIGLIAEDVAELFPEVVTYNEEGQPQGIQYQRLSVILLKALQELTERVNKLENK